MIRHLIAYACLGLVGLPLVVHAFDRQALQDRIEQVPALEGHFTQTRWLSDVDTTLESQGHFAYVRDEKVVWQLTMPVEDTLVLTPDAHESAPSNSARQGGREQIAALLLQLLGGDWSALESRFKQHLQGSADDWRMRLTPRDPALAERIAEIRLSGGRYIDHMEMDTTGGDRLRIDFRDQKPLTPKAIDALPDATPR
ncbi:outer membrane lipoprotein carrier protein LolA [Chromohalobacter marismortui]|uniref:Outer membrane lipoprotein carrier protein LolA n=1 Tax=Chromohalobacter marismortui TaxID=42055 RepID=A0A4R7NLK6_9GAMM|nr:MULTISPECIES: outer membrane lipoprotein carrier protein LolA [Chromohalobacter]MCI0510236.1 outer membrane lipoprotein carrier protein LolA [Chromohalobacter sp.]MCI0593412.1 outer membrane lipoprotein carrier protein LolA [Chromohalobacter sp.]TDU21654.1 outer membrane lipoprotein carrier protein LolA [Chromohalobacter marismortui]